MARTVSNCICGDSSCKIPHGLCHCGCGRQTWIPDGSDSRYGWIKGVPVRFVGGHNGRISPVIEKAKPFKIDGVYCRLIPLTRGYHTIVWESDYEWLMQWKWIALVNRKRNSVYVARAGERVNGKSTSISMHRFILNAPDGIEVDHQFGNTLDNRRSVLRFATFHQNQCNKRLMKSNQLGLKGVSKRGDLYEARITINRKTVRLGKATTPEAAHELYKLGAVKYYGEFARFE